MYNRLSDYLCRLEQTRYVYFVSSKGWNICSYGNHHSHSTEQYNNVTLQDNRTLTQLRNKRVYSQASLFLRISFYRQVYSKTRHPRSIRGGGIGGARGGWLGGIGWVFCKQSLRILNEWCVRKCSRRLRGRDASRPTCEHMTPRCRNLIHIRFTDLICGIW